jgi:hypothetical protein
MCVKWPNDRRGHRDSASAADPTPYVRVPSFEAPAGSRCLHRLASTDWLALLLSVFIGATVKVVRTIEVTPQHHETVFVHLDSVHRQMLPQEHACQLASALASFRIAVIECFGALYL